MSGVFWCCCGVQIPPEDCACACVCPEAWIFSNFAVEHPVDGWLGGLYYEEDDGALLSVNNRSQDWTVLFWLNGCELQDERGMLWNTFHQDDMDSQLYIGVVNSGTEFVLETQAIINSEDAGQAATMTFSLPLNEGLESGCAMVSLEYEQKDLGGGIKGPRFKLSLRWKDQFGEYVEVKEVEHDRRDFPGETGSDWGWTALPGSETFIGNSFPPGTGSGEPGYLWWEKYGQAPENFTIYFDGCMNNLHLYDHWLNPSQYDAAWNDGAGLFDPDAWERWCPLDFDAGENQIGEKADTTLIFVDGGTTWSEIGGRITYVPPAP